MAAESKTQPVVLLGLVLVTALACPARAAQELSVYQDLAEATSRIARLEEKPYQALMDANGGFFQSEVIIFRDVETGGEVWSLTREACTEIANIERRCAWSCNGQYISFIGNSVFFNYTNGRLWKRTWAGYNYVANADGSKKRKLWAAADGKLRMFQDKFNNWDAKRPNVLYYTGNARKDLLWRITLADGLKAGKAEAVYRFPTELPKIIQEVSDENFMLVEERGEKPNCYVVNLNKDPKDEKFCLIYPLKGMVHPGSFRFRRGRRYVTGGYERRKGLTGGIVLEFDEEGLKPTTIRTHLTAGRQMWHLWYGLPDDRVGFFGKYKGKDGLYLQHPGQAPVLMADVPDGHVTWCGQDPQWFFAAVGPGRVKGRDEQYGRRLLACNADGKTVKVICTPFDRRRPGKSSYASIPRPNQSPDATKCWFHSSMLNPDNKYTGSYVAVFRRPYPPAALRLKPGAKAVELEWTPHTLSHEVKGYHVYRSEDGGRTFAEVTDGAVAGTSFKDATARPGETYVYALTAEEWSRLESDVTSTTLAVSLAARRARPPVKAGGAGEAVRGWDRTPPGPVVNFRASRRADGLIVLKWDRHAARDFRYYNVYASSSGPPATSQKRLLVSPPYAETSYIDWTAPKGKAVHYAITAVDWQGNESAPARAAQRRRAMPNVE